MAPSGILSRFLRILNFSFEPNRRRLERSGEIGGSELADASVPVDEGVIPMLREIPAPRLGLGYRG